MKKLFLMILFSSSVWADPITIEKPVICDRNETIFKALAGKNYQEKPVWLGASDEKLVNYSLWVNASTKTWTIVQFNSDIACILGTGEAFTLMSKKSTL